MTSPIARRRWSRPLLLVLCCAGAIVILVRFLDDLGYSLSGRTTWNAIELAKPLIQARADEALRRFGMDPSQFTGAVTTVTPNPEIDFGGDEAWFVRYWVKPPIDHAQQLMSPGELRVYLNDQGTVRRVEKGAGDVRELLYGKNRCINTGMSYEEVRERLGKPDSHHPTPQRLHNRGKEVWTYLANATRRMTTYVYFEDHRVTTTTAGTPPFGSLLSRAFLERFKKPNRPVSKILQWDRGRGK